MKVLLVGNPRTVMGFNRLTKLPSLNLASLAANVDDGIAEIRIADLVLYAKKANQVLKSILLDYRPDVVGFTAMSFQFDTAVQLMKITRETLEGIKIILGGYHATADAENILTGRHAGLIDFMVDGEGEVTFNALLKAIAKGGVYENVPGLVFLKNGHVVKTPRSELLPPDRLKIPKREARIFKKGFHMLGMPGDVIETSRGCVYDCNFCSIRNMYGKSFRKFSIDRIINDLEDAKRFGAKGVFIADDNITLDGKRYQQLCEQIIDARLNLTFAVQASVRGFIKSPELAEAMANAGTKFVFLGIENASDSALEFMHKSNQLQSSDTLMVVKQLKKHGILVVGGFIFGYPEDTQQTMIENFEYAKKLGVDIQLFNILTPHLKTELRDELLAEGLVTNPYDYSKYNHYASNVKTRHLSDEALFRIRNRLDARYPVESGAIFRLFKAYPVFFTKLMFNMIADEPQNWINFTTGFLNKKV
ncbi:MAG: B12-binding domain-containing radical SAM protein [Bacteroidales bacterium]|nr:B12-binding domain-containing radical SAM protein [Bacteroidales bacterium]